MHQRSICLCPACVTRATAEDDEMRLMARVSIAVLAIRRQTKRRVINPRDAGKAAYSREGAAELICDRPHGARVPVSALASAGESP